MSFIDNRIAAQQYIWHFTDDFNGWRLKQEILNDIKALDKSGMVIPDHGYTKKVSDTYQAVYDFHALTASKEGTYQWQIASYAGYTDIEGETNPEFKVPTDETGTEKYRCIVTNSDGSTENGIFTVIVYSSDVPLTGDSSNPVLWALLALMSFASAVVLIKKYTA